MNDTTRHHTHDIAVVGAGPAGLLAALLLRADGHDVVLVGPVQTTDEHRRTVALLKASTELVARAGVWDAVRDRATPLRKMTLVDDTGRLLGAPTVTFDADETGEAAFGYNIAAADLAQTLAEAYDGPHVTERAETVTHGMPNAILTENGRTITAACVVGADGRASRVRAGAGIETVSWTYDQAALVCVLEHEAPHGDRSVEFHRRGGPFVIVPMEGNRSSVVYCGAPGDIDRLAGADEDALGAMLTADAHFTYGTMRPITPVQVYPMSSFVAKAFAADGVALVGDAAHGFPPIGAQGLNLGLRDVDALVAALKDGASPAVLAGYAASRRADVLTRTGGVDLLNRSLLSDFLPFQLARSAGLALARESGPLRRRMMREGMRPALAP